MYNNSRQEGTIVLNNFYWDCFLDTVINVIDVSDISLFGQLTLKKPLFNLLNLYDEKVISYHQVITVRNWVLVITSKFTMKIVGYGTIIQATVDIPGIDAITHLS